MVVVELSGFVFMFVRVRGDFYVNLFFVWVFFWVDVMVIINFV